MNDYRPVHRLTPLLRLWTLVLALIAVAVVNLNASTLASLGTFLRGDGSLLPILLAVGAFALLCAAVWLLSGAWWRAEGYRLTEEEVSLKRGVLSRQERSARYDRIQAVDVVESVIARIFRVAAVRIETAGGSNSVIEISYLDKRVATALREEVLGHVRGEATAQPEQQSTTVVEEIPIARSLGAVALNIGAVASTVVMLALAVPLGIAAAVPLIVGLGPAIWRIVDNSWRFTARLTEDGSALDVTYGLADRRRQTIPLHRIHGVSIRQPVLWRLTGWWMLKVSIAGYGSGNDKESGTTTLLPVGDRETAMRLAALIGPLTRAELEEFARPEGHTAPDFTSPRRARWVSPVDLSQQSTTLLPGVAVCHLGRFSRRVSLIETPHIQELTLKRGPLQHLLSLCTVTFDLISGPVSMGGADLDTRDGRQLLDALRQRRLPAYTSSHDHSVDEPGPPAA